MSSANVTLGGRPYTIKGKNLGPAAAWRAKFNGSRMMQIFLSLDEAAIQLVGVLDQMTDAQGRALKMSEMDINVSDIIGLVRTLPVIVNGLAASVDEMIAMLFDYSPELAADKDWLLENANDEQAIAAFVEVLKLNFPIMAVWGLVRGPLAARTVQNSPSPNGASGQRHGSRKVRA